MTWWCSASDVAWSWQWRAYPGVWLFLIVLVLLRQSTWRHAPADAGPPRTSLFLLGLLCIWLAVDWPIGPLGAGYLLSAHTISFILLGMIAPALLLLSLPLATWSPEPDGALGRILRFLAEPLPALVVFNGTLMMTHLPDFVDGWMNTQLGTFGNDLAWLLAGAVLWWPVVAPRPGIGRLSPPAQMGYLFVASILPTIPAMLLVFASFPAYGLYELAPRVFPILNPGSDQQLAGLLMKVIGDIPLWIGFGIIFFRWQRHEIGSTPPAHQSAA